MLLHQPAVTNAGPNDFNDEGYYGRNILNAPVFLRTSLPDAYQYYMSNVLLECENGVMVDDPEAPLPPTVPPVPSVPDAPIEIDPGECGYGACADIPAVPFPAFPTSA